MFQALTGGQESLLQHVIRIQPPAQRFGQAEMNHPPQTLPLAGKHRGQSLRVTGPQPALKVFHSDIGISGHVGSP